MTTPDERTKALLRANEFLAELSQLTEPVDVTLIRSKASRLLRHYPDAALLYEIARQSTWLAAHDPATGAKTVRVELPPLRTAEEFVKKFAEAEQNNRRADVRDGKLVDAETFRARLGLTKTHLRRLIRSGSVFSITVDGRDYYPDLFLKEAQHRKRLYAICRLIWPAPPESRLHYLESRRGNLGGITPLQCLRDEERYQLLRRMSRGFALEYHRITITAFAGNHEAEPESQPAAYDVAEDCDPRTPLWQRCTDAMDTHGYTGVFAPYSFLRDATVFVNQLRVGSRGPERLARLTVAVTSRIAEICVQRFESHGYKLSVPIESEGATIEDVMRAVFLALRRSRGR